MVTNATSYEKLNIPRGSKFSHVVGLIHGFKDIIFKSVSEISCRSSLSLTFIS